MKRRQVENKLILKIIMEGVILVLVIMVAFTLNNGQKKDYNRVSSEMKEEQQVECIDIETPYATLKFPKELSQQVKVDVSEDGAYTVSFHGTLVGKDEIHLCDLIFGGEEGYTVGHMITKEGTESVAVNINYYDYESCDLTNDEIIEIQKMQRAVEHVIDKLVETGELELEN